MVLQSCFLVVERSLCTIVAKIRWWKTLAWAFAATCLIRALSDSSRQHSTYAGGPWYQSLATFNIHWRDCYDCFFLRLVPNLQIPILLRSGWLKDRWPGTHLQELMVFRP